ncbi:SHOCT domain-containing protein [Salinibacterium sp. G-O1]|uniref:SHOCT domain-containing protein n=1 Tax=Salinibacterium sp. G-O1 TaxID=3046208 RepID=UPI0024B8C54B|nr:SHOCT domain-containing protein [Salinibacterium sp. G-O1]MDJ0336139.1 SHOCT domain-containing protein [Salinibacterium sp. G-O1]
MNWGYSGMAGWAWGFGALVVVGVVILVIVLIRLLGKPSSSTSSPKRILDERYARGEVTTEEYRERLSALGLDT